MPTEKPRVTITLAPEQLQRIDVFRFENKMKNQTQAILSLIDAGLAELEEEAKKSPDTTEAAPGEFNISIEESNKLLVDLGYIKPGEILADADLAFLEHVIGLLDTWFSEKQ